MLHEFFIELIIIYCTRDIVSNSVRLLSFRTDLPHSALLIPIALSAAFDWLPSVVWFLWYLDVRSQRQILLEPELRMNWPRGPGFFDLKKIGKICGTCSPQFSVFEIDIFTILYEISTNELWISINVVKKIWKDAKNYRVGASIRFVFCYRWYNLVILLTKNRN